jgi:hypothetical protein
MLLCIADSKTVSEPVAMTEIIAIYTPTMIYTAPCVMFWMLEDPLRGQVGGGLALEIETFLGPGKLYHIVV